MTKPLFTKEQAEQWAEEHTESKSLSEAWYVMEVMHASFLAGLAKAAEMIEACPTVYNNQTLGMTAWNNYQKEDATHQAKLVGVRPIEGEESSDDQA